MKTMTLLLTLIMAASATNALAMGKATCKPLTGTYEVSSCEGLKEIWLPSNQAPSQNGSLSDFMAKLPEGGLIHITQGQCGSVTLSYGSTTVELRQGKSHLEGPTNPDSGSSSLDRKVCFGHESFDVELKNVYVYVPIISVWTSTARWHLQASGDGELELTYKSRGLGTDNVQGQCTLKPVAGAFEHG